MARQVFACNVLRSMTAFKLQPTFASELQWPRVAAAQPAMCCAGGKSHKPAVLAHAAEQDLL